MPTNTSLDEIEEQPETRSQVADSKKVISCVAKEQAVKQRYGKDVLITGTIDLNDDGTYKEVTLRIQSPKNKNYVLTEYFINNTTARVTLAYNVADRTIETQFDRYLDAEVTLIDLISEE